MTPLAPHRATTRPERGRLDYILVGSPTTDGRGSIESARLACTERAGDVFASDHFGVVADIRG